MHYILFYEVVDNFAAERVPFRADHLGLVRGAYELADPADGAVLVFRGPTPEAAEAFARADPYVKNGLVSRWRVRPWMTVVGDGGTMPSV